MKLAPITNGMIFLLAATLGTPSVAIAADYGSGTSTQIRQCSATPCFSGERPVITGINQAFANQGLNFTLTSGSSNAFTNVSFGGALPLPTIKASGVAALSRQVFSATWGFQEFTWTGASPTAFAVSGIIDYTTTGRRPGFLPEDGTGILQGTLLLYDPNVFEAINRSEILQSESLFKGSQGSGTSQSGVLTLSTTNLANGNFMMLAPGQRVGVAMLLDLSAISGAFVDSSNSFTVGLDPNLSADVRRQLELFLVPGGQIAAVPEPSQWLLLIFGFGIAGMRLRWNRPICQAS